jgi:hypothetical protein
VLVTLVCASLAPASAAGAPTVTKPQPNPSPLWQNFPLGQKLKPATSRPQRAVFAPPRPQLRRAGSGGTSAALIALAAAAVAVLAAAVLPAGMLRPDRAATFLVRRRPALATLGAALLVAAALMLLVDARV